MARITCKFSGITYKCEHVPMTLNHREISHPIFHLPQQKLLSLYSRYSDGALSSTDSYLLFLSLLHSTGAVTFKHPAIYTTETDKIIAANISQLVTVIFKSNAIVHPTFRQPGFVLREDTASLSNIHIWIKAWSRNITEFSLGLSTIRDRENLMEIQNKLTALIKSPETKDTQLASAVANWAALAADFPKNKLESWKGIIRRCFNLEAMFSTPKSELAEIKSYCEENLEVGSLHYHTLMKVLKTGIANHNDFLGLDSGFFCDEDNSGDLGYTLLTTDNTVQEATMLDIISRAPTSPPVESSYPSKIAFLRAKLAYQQARKFEESKKKEELKNKELDI